MAQTPAETTFKNLRWADTNGAPVCPSCGSVEAYEARRPNGALRFRCKGCKKDFTVTSGTLFASHKLPLKSYLAAIAVFCNEVKGKSALALSRAGPVLQIRIRIAAQVSFSGEILSCPPQKLGAGLFRFSVA